MDAKNKTCKAHVGLVIALKWYLLTKNQTQEPRMIHRSFTAGWVDFHLLQTGTRYANVSET